LLLLIVATLALLWLRVAAAAPTGHDPRIVAGCGLVAGWTISARLRRRLREHREEGVLAAEALDPGSSRLYALLWGGTAGLVVAGFILVVLPRDAAVFAPSLAIGASAGAASWPFWAPARLSGRGAPVRPRPSDRRSAVLLILLLAAASAALARLALARGGLADAILVAAVLNAAGLFWLIRADDQLARFHAIAGHGPWPSAVLQLGPAVGFAIAAAALTAALAGARVAALGAALDFILLVIALVRLWLFRLHARRFADPILALAIGATAMAFVAVPPLAFLLAAGLAATLYRRAGRATWMMD
jgi:hypothetical protein